MTKPSPAAHHAIELLISGKLSRLPSAAASVFILVTLFATWRGYAFLRALCLAFALFVAAAGLAVAHVPQVGAVFWLFNVFNGWIRPLAFDCLDAVLRAVPPGDPKAVVDAIDKFCWSGRLLMNVGDVKGAIIDAALEGCAPRAAVELGAHIGYSTVRFARLLKKGSGAQLHSVDPDPIGHSVKAALVAHAGVGDRVVPYYGFSGDFLRGWAKAERPPIDFLLLDHVSELYKPDLQLAMDLGILSDGCVVVADNVVTPGAPVYRAWMLAHPDFKTTVHSTRVEYSADIEDEVLVSVYTKKAPAAGC